MIGRWTVWVALLCAAIAGFLGALSWSADGWTFGTIGWGLACLVMLDAAWVFRRMSRRRRRVSGTAVADSSGPAENPRDSDAE